MAKIILTESQYETLENTLLEMTMRSYIFDWDDNILYMPTTIKMDKKVGDEWVTTDVSTEDFTHVRTNPNYRLRNGNPKEAFKDFTESKSFIEDTKKAIHNNSFAPSADKFKEALIYANPFAINTARGHEPKIIRDGVRLFIDMVFTDEEKDEMLGNVRRVLNKTKNLTDSQAIDFYLDEMGEYYPVTSSEFGDRFDLDIFDGASSPEHTKKVAIEHFTKKVFHNIEKLVGSDYKKFSIGFSDDDMGNVKAAEEFIENELKITYPEIHFVVYDTSDKGKRKIVIEKGE